MNKKRRKKTRLRGTHTAGRGFKKKARGKGHRGGVGKAGTGKRADQKKNLIKYPFGKDKTLRKKKKIELKTINVGDIEENFDNLKDKGKIKDNTIILKGYKVLGKGEIKHKLKVIANEFSNSAKEKIVGAGGEASTK